jgi:pectate lyase
MLPRFRGLAAVALLSGLAMLAGGAHAEPLSLSRALRQVSAWYASDEAQQLAENVLSWQSEEGTWPKGIDTLNAPAPRGGSRHGTFDNGSTRDELRFLARVHQATGRSDCRDAFLRGLDVILAAQYPTGGWPQSTPAGTGYARHITFNDHTMVGIMELLREVAEGEAYGFVGTERREAARAAVRRGVDCIVRCQIRVGQRLTAWCAQHDAETLAPRAARTYELESLSGAESAGILLFLMSLENPSPEVAKAVHAGAAWFEAVQIRGFRQVRVDGDKRIVADPAAPPMWARFYDLETQQPFFCGRDGVKRGQLADIESERRNGYAWYGDWGRRVLERYARWQPG